MPEKAVRIGEAEQVMQDPGIAKIDLRGFHLTLSDILMPGLQLPNHECSSEDIEIGPCGFIG
jgi:hypothetical protein